MNLAELIEAFRDTADDTAEPYLWSDSVLTRYFNEAEREVCRRAHAIVDSSTSSICTITTVSGTSEYTISPKIIQIRRATIPSKQNRLIYPVKHDLMDEYIPNWESQSGLVTAYVVGLNSNKIKLFRNPDEAYDIKMTVFREPLNKMNSPDDIPEINERYHEGMINWVLYKAYRHNDPETEQARKSMGFLKAFEDEFGTRDEASAKEEEFMINQRSFVFNSGAR